MPSMSLESVPLARKQNAANSIHPLIELKKLQRGEDYNSKYLMTDAGLPYVTIGTANHGLRGPIVG